MRMVTEWIGHNGNSYCIATDGERLRPQHIVLEKHVDVFGTEYWGSIYDCDGVLMARVLELSSGDLSLGPRTKPLDDLYTKTTTKDT